LSKRLDHSINFKSIKGIKFGKDDKKIIQPINMKKTLILITIGATVLACSPKTGEITKTENAPIVFPSTELANGFEMYKANCGNCHKLKNEMNYSKEKWAKILPRMAKKAKLNATQEKSISDYVYWRIAQNN
jgi:nitrate/TMAO reductase-like tetraheme cytochrome c subunit